VGLSGVGVVHELQEPWQEKSQMFNTLRYAKRLEEAGIPRQQAEAHVQIIAEIVEGDLATKQDVKELKDEMQKLEYRLVIKLGALVAGLGAVTVAATTATLKLLLSK
jgi:hypothetical protein